MVKIKPTGEITANLVEGNYRAYLRGDKSLKWMIGEINTVGLQDAKFVEVLDKVDKYTPSNEIVKERAEELRRELRILKLIWRPTHGN